VPKERPQLSAWRHVEAEFSKAAADADPEQLLIALRMAQMLEGIE
jgi:hypothetical protein